MAIYAGPFLGPFATSTFCLKQAYWTCTKRTDESDADNMELHDHEFKLMLKHLFFFHGLYSSFGESCGYNTPMTIENFEEAIEDLFDNTMPTDQVETNYQKLGENPTFGAFVCHMTEIYLSDEAPATHVSSLMAEEKMGYGSVRRSFSEGPSSRSRALSGVSEHLGSMTHEVISCVQYSCRDIDTWIKQIQELGVVPFKSLIDDILVTRVVITQDMHNTDTCVVFMWHLDNGQGYREFEEANMEDGGVFIQAAEEGIISVPFKHIFISSVSHDGWNARIRPCDILNLAYFNTKSHVGFADSLQEDIDSTGRTSGALQNYVGKISASTGSQGGILSHYSEKAWTDTGENRTKSFQDDPPPKYMISGDISNISCTVKATNEVFTWLADAAR